MATGGTTGGCGALPGVLSVQLCRSCCISSSSGVSSGGGPISFGRKGQDMVLAALHDAAGASGGGYEAAARPPVGPQVGVRSVVWDAGLFQVVVACLQWF